MKNEIQNDWQPEVSSLFNTLKKHGLDVVTTIETALEADDCWMTVSNKETKVETKIYLVLGNEPGVIMADWVCNANESIINKVEDEHYARWEDRKQPTKVVNRA